MFKLFCTFCAWEIVKRLVLVLVVVLVLDTRKGGGEAGWRVLPKRFFTVVLDAKILKFVDSFLKFVSLLRGENWFKV